MKKKEKKCPFKDKRKCCERFTSLCEATHEWRCNFYDYMKGCIKGYKNNNDEEYNNMKAIFEVNFKLSDMISKEELVKYYQGNVFKLMKWLYDEEGMGIFQNALKLVEIRRK